MTRTKPGIFKNLNSEKNGTTAEEVVTRLREMIQRGEISAGDRLPPERDLAKLLGVSRPTLRAGIRSLSTVGILQSRQGAGTFVAEAEESPTLATSEQMTLLAEEIAGMYASLENPGQYLVHDMQFHQTVAAASGNRILTSLMNMVATILFDYR